MTKNQKKKAFGYIRVSTAMQVEGGYSLDDQENRIRQHAKANDMTLVDIYRDEGKSGKNISGRPGFQKMLEAIRNGQKIDYVLVTRLSRFGRNASDVMTALKTLQSHGVALWCIEDMLDSSTKMGDAMLKMSSIFAEMERENIRGQTRAGRYEKARQGKWNGGQAPYGYQIGRNADGTSSGVLVVDKGEAKVVRQIFDWYVNDNVGIAGIATRLNENGIRKTPREREPDVLYAGVSEEDNRESGLRWKDTLRGAEVDARRGLGQRVPPESAGRLQGLQGSA